MKKAVNKVITAQVSAHLAVLFRRRAIRYAATKSVVAASLNETKRFCASVLSLHMNTELTNQIIEYVADKFIDFFIIYH